MFPDGKMLAEVKSNDGQNSVWVRNIPTNTDTQVLAPTPLHYSGLTISPDGNQLYFVRQDANDSQDANLYTVSVLGGTPRQLLHDISGPVCFSPDAKNIVYMRIPKRHKDFSSELHSADQNGENDEVLSKNSGFTLNASYSPDGSEVAWVQLEQTGPALILLHLKSRHQDRISLPDGVDFINKINWLPDGKHLLLNAELPNSYHRAFGQFAVMAVRSGNFRRITNDAASYQGLTLSADARTLATLIVGVGSRIDYFRTADGILLTSNSSRHSPFALNWIDEERTALFGVSGGVLEISVIERDTGRSDPMSPGKPVLAPTSGVITCLSNRVVFAGTTLKSDSLITELYRINSDGTDLTALVGTDGAMEPSCPLHSHIVFYTIQEPSKGKATAWAAPLEGGTPRKVMDLPSMMSPVYSSDGKIAACQVQSGGRWNVIIKDVNSQRTLRELNLKGFLGGDALHFPVMIRHWCMFRISGTS